MPELPYLRKLLGDAWVDQQIFSEKPVHLLGRWQKKNANNPWVKYTEDLAKAILTSEKIKVNPEILAQKLKEDYVPTLAEMESTVFLVQKGFDVTVEPCAPEKGPDLRADSNGVSYFVEVRAIGYSEEDERVDLVTKEIFGRLGPVPSSYHVNVEFGEEYEANTPELNRAVESVLESLEYLKNDQPKKATLYYLSSEKAMLTPGGGFDPSFIPHSERERLYKEIAENAQFVAHFDHLGAVQQGTAASASRRLKLPPEPLKTHERLKKILKKKKNQLPKGERGILLMEASELFMLDEFTVESALYGDLVVEFPPVKSADERVGEPTARRNNQGFFRDTSRASAIVMHKRVSEKGEVRNEWKVYPTNRANDDTIHLTLAELRRFGDLGEREHLCAENVKPGNEK
jgi:hypothetical protein